MSGSWARAPSCTCRASAKHEDGASRVHDAAEAISTAPTDLRSGIEADGHGTRPRTIVSIIGVLRTAEEPIPNTDRGATAARAHHTLVSADRRAEAHRRPTRRTRRSRVSASGTRRRLKPHRQHALGDDPQPVAQTLRRVTFELSAAVRAGLAVVTAQTTSGPCPWARMSSRSRCTLPAHVLVVAELPRRGTGRA